MYRLLVLLLLLSGGILVVNCTGTAATTESSRIAQTPEPRADNFALVFRSRSCGVGDDNVLDTSTGTLIHTPIGDTVALTIPLQLTKDEMDAIYQKVSAIAFFSYPADLHIPKDEVRGTNVPAMTYSLSIRNGMQSNTVTWTDDVFEPKREHIERFRELIRLIEQSMNAHPEMHNLPEAKVGCV